MWYPSKSDFFQKKQRPGTETVNSFSDFRFGFVWLIKPVSVPVGKNLTIIKLKFENVFYNIIIYLVKEKLTI